MYIGLDIGRQVVKLVALEKSKTGYKVVKTAQRFIPDQNRPYDPEKVDLPIRVIAIKELLRQNGIKPKRLKKMFFCNCSKETKTAFCQTNSSENIIFIEISNLFGVCRSRPALPLPPLPRIWMECFLPRTIWSTRWS